MEELREKMPECFDDNGEPNNLFNFLMISVAIGLAKEIIRLVMEVKYGIEKDN